MYASPSSEKKKKIRWRNMHFSSGYIRRRDETQRVNGLNWIGKIFFNFLFSFSPYSLAWQKPEKDSCQLTWKDRNTYKEKEERNRSSGRAGRLTWLTTGELLLCPIENKRYIDGKKRDRNDRVLGPVKCWECTAETKERNEKPFSGVYSWVTTGRKRGKCWWARRVSLAAAASQ